MNIYNVPFADITHASEQLRQLPNAEFPIRISTTYLVYMAERALW